MKFKKLEEIWETEQKYDDLRWSSDKPLEEWSIEQIRELRAELPDVISSLASWQNTERSLSRADRKRVGMIKKKLQEFQWILIREDQRRQKRHAHVERLETIIDPVDRGIGASVKSYGLKAPLKGSDFYKEIPSVYGPRSKEEVH